MNTMGERMPLKGQAYQPIPDFESLEIGSDNTDHQLSQRNNQRDYVFKATMGVAALSLMAVVVWALSPAAVTNSKTVQHAIDVEMPIEGRAWSAKAEPLSTLDPRKLGLLTAHRPSISSPGLIFGEMLKQQSPLPTNSWFENLLLGRSNTEIENKIFTVPYVTDTAGPIPGIRAHPAHVFALPTQVMMTYEVDSGLTLGAVDKFQPHHKVRTNKNPDRKLILQITKVAIELEWLSDAYANTGVGPTMRTPIVRGSPYSSMEYIHATPRIVAKRLPGQDLIIDNDPTKILECGEGEGNFSKTPQKITRELRVHFRTSDFTWLLFVSEATEFECSKVNYGENSINHFFELRATKPMKRGMIRVALANNCTEGLNPEYCEELYSPRNNDAYAKLLRDHAEIYPTAEADIRFTFPSQSTEEEELRLNIDWKPASMAHLSMLADENTDDFVGPADIPVTKDGIPQIELLMFAMPHHQERLRPVTSTSSNAIQQVGCTPTLHGVACPVLGGYWSMVEHLHRAEFTAPRPARPEMVPAIQRALKTDIAYRLPHNYMIGAGDTYFSGKMLGKLARILLIADEYGGVSKSEFDSALNHLCEGIQVWVNGSAASSMLYDRAWGGIVTCGCDYNDETGLCNNEYPDCPGLYDMGHNFGAGFYNDHHYHYGYHIYAAAVAAKFNNQWGKKYHEHILLYIRDIANPSEDDPYFTTWRHKDWYTGHSWASGIVTINGKPYPNGRNQESVSEAISAYEGIALYGDVMAEIYAKSADVTASQKQDSSLKLRDMGRLLMATEIRAARTYWHVQKRGAPGVSRIYPDIYEPKMVGMIWSLLAQEQTWFGNEPWKSYGIQLMPITPAAELRDQPVTWVREMLPVYSESCNNSTECEQQGWSILEFTSLASAGYWKSAWDNVDRLDPALYETAGGNGHSRSNTLWYIATRPSLAEVVENEEEFEEEERAKADNEVHI